MPSRSDRHGPDERPSEADADVEHRPSHLVWPEVAARQVEPGAEPDVSPLELLNRVDHLRLEARLEECFPQEMLGLLGRPIVVARQHHGRHG